MFHFTFFHNGKDWLISHRKNLFLLAGISVFGTLTFESGFLRGEISQSKPLVVSIPALIEPSGTTDTAGPRQEVEAGGVERVASQSNEKQVVGSCPLVGSRNSNKYHLSTCAVAKRIKPENKVCFSSKEDAEKRGYIAGCVK